ncbi:helix-turn-helix domain-containing protein [Shewanella kaireitica]|uniref:helix-turn-helix domain-containing protein n=1 Tax=Shewanella kaireitica TaxID=212021 RepID=UPI00200FF5F7|nr:AraC family transcriptional regulator [Shewanella kaireitica]MCL1095991.1 AraC family transcriptional regulator [Shewanella kaireitica]
MQIWSKPPKNQTIAKYVALFWLIEKTNKDESYHFPKLNPEPATHLILCPQQQRYIYQTLPTESNGTGCHWLYPQQQTLQLDHSQRFIYLGIKFHIGALYSLNIEGYSHPTLNQAVDADLSQLLGTKSSDIEQLIELGRIDATKCCDKLDELLLPLFNTTYEDQHSELTRKVLPLLENSLISELGNKLHCSQRTLERSFNRVTGLTMKQCQSMNKLEAMLEYIYQRETVDIDWAEVAFKFGFSDQPHLIRHLKKQIGLTPKNYAEQRGLTIDIYGGVESR